LSKIVPRTFRGTRDFLPTELLGRRKILKIIEEAYRRYGFQPLETPAIEYLDILTGKSEENDKLIYEIKRARGGEGDSAETAIALRYDLTVPLARVVAQHPELPRPFKRYQIQPVWRADRPQPRQGRFREFVQCDADILGTDSLLADAEMIALMNEVLRDLGFEGYQIRVSSRKLLMGLVELATGSREKTADFCRAIDKLDKIGWDGVKKELAESGLDGDKSRVLLEALQKALGLKPDFDQARGLIEKSSVALEGLKEIQTIYAESLDLGVNADHLACDPTLARGLDYYTGPIFESVLTELPHMGSLSGGGRYDGLVETFSKNRVPATGMSFGLDRIQTALTQLEKFQPVASETQVLIARFDSEGIPENLRIASMLRKENLRVEIWYDDDRMKKQFSYADKQQIPLVIIAGPDERVKGEVSLKNLRTGKQQKIQMDLLAQAVRAELESLEV
jgi:histidyl-tRNA synthetase